MRVRSQWVKACGLVLLVAGWAVGAGAQGANSTQGAQAGGAAAQAVPASVSVKLLVFDVTSVKLDKSDNRLFVSVFPQNGDGFTMEYVPLELVIRYLYGLHDDAVISGLPDWAKSDPYTIRGKVAESDVAEWKTYSEQNKKRVAQQLLADRFKLQMHIVSHEGPIYELVVAPGGPKMSAVAPANYGFGEMIVTGGVIESYRPGIVKGHNITMDRFIEYLSGLRLGREIQDKTGLTGNYDFTLGTAPLEASSPGEAGGAASLPGGTDPLIFTDLQHQLGLKLVPASGSVVSYGVDHVERASPD